MPPPATPLTLAIGMFDGIHLGHQAVLRAAAASARRHPDGIAACLTFHPHTAHLLHPRRAPLLLCTPEQNRLQITTCGITRIHTLPFTPALAATPPADFLTLLKKTFPTLTEIVVGANFTFGKNRAGNADTLPALAAAIHCTTRIIPPVEWEGAVISSTRIRAAVEAGHLPAAAAMLGRPFALAGQIIHGRAIARTQGYPTANLRPRLPIRPAPGVYAAHLHLPDGPRPGPAFVPDPADPAQAHFGDIVEIHLPGLTRDLYHLQTEITFTRRLRSYTPFPTLAAAATQLAQDTTQALEG